MIKYTWDNIIINPTSKSAKYCIGKKVYFANTPSACLRYANENNNNHVEKLVNIYETDYPFLINESKRIFCNAIILKLDEIELYSPFENYSDFRQAFKQHTHYINKYGLWICEKTNNPNKNILRLVTNIFIQGVTILSDKNNFISWRELLERFTFEDGIPCGNK